ncbi:PLAT/LH2 domain-containing protein [Ruminococcus flavefaciens]|uniref:PLAT/LH2 domain-containing protein n=1 Tax=Ruminococcus flavefaciens TaxID=1265 RepID=UPI00048BA91F|nr:PLAT/LH2 domain-containing protein [Ruminococcus flavefaciens]
MENYGLIITASHLEPASNLSAKERAAELAELQEEWKQRNANADHVTEMFKRNSIRVLKRAQNRSLVQLESDIKLFASNVKSYNISYIYINCHGNSGILALVLNGKRTTTISYTKLKAMLDMIPGKKVLMIESCLSGSAIENVNTGATVFKDKNYFVITASRPYEFAWGGNVGGNFTNLWCKGAGYDYKNTSSKARAADTNNDGYVSVTDLCDYTEGVFMKNATDSSYQSDMCYPEKTYFPVFGTSAVRSDLYYFIVEIRTADEKDAGTDADIMINLHGDKNETGFKNLDTPDYDDFERGSAKSYLISTNVNIGTIQSFTIKSNNAGKDPGYKLERVKIIDANNNKVYPAITCNQWLGSGHLSHRFYMDMSGHRYYIKLTMSDVDGAGTDANIEVKLHGAISDSSFYSLDTENYDDFERGTTKEYEIIVNKNIGQPQYITVKTDNAGKDAAMSFAQIIVRDGATRKEYNAVYGGWLNSSKTSVKLKLSENMYVYNVTARVGDKNYAGTDADVDIKLYGSAGETDFVRFPDDPNRDDFERNSDNKVVVSTIRNIGRLQGIGIRHNNVGKGAELYISTVTIKEQNTGNTYRCYFNSWIEGKNNEVKGFIVNR